MLEDSKQQITNDRSQFIKNSNHMEVRCQSLQDNSAQPGLHKIHYFHVHAIVSAVVIIHHWATVNVSVNN